MHSLGAHTTRAHNSVVSTARHHQPHGRCRNSSRSLIAPRYQSQRQQDQLQQLFQQARDAPRITTPPQPLVEPPPAPAATPRSGTQPQQQEQKKKRRGSVPAGSAAHSTHSSRQQQQQAPAAPADASPQPPNLQQQPQQQQPPFPSRRQRPASMEFGVMLSQLQEWRSRHLSAHVPRHCFDAPQLGAWVRHMRKQHKEGRLEQWKVDSLNTLGFEWQLTDQQAKWHNCYHQLRRYRVLHGTTDIDVERSSQDGCDWRMVAWWLRKQAKLLAKQKLSSQQRAMLEQLGVRLTVPRQLVQRTAQLQATNSTERRRLRKKWKLQDNMHHEAHRQQRQQELQQLLQERRQQRQVVHRRQQLMWQAARLATEEGALQQAGYGSVDSQQQQQPQQQQQQEDKQQSQAKLVGIALQQLQEVQQLSVAMHQQAPQIDVLPGAATPDSSTTIMSLQPRQVASQQKQQQGQDQEQQSEMAAANEHAYAQEPDTQHQAVTAVATDAAAEQPPQPPQQQQQHQHQPKTGRVEAGALLFAPNRRRKRTKHQSRQEKWLAGAAGDS